MTPAVSILIPSFNGRQFLEERVESIFGQTLSSWELIVVDNYSDDGAWEFFQSVAKKDGRVRVSQAPRNGLYANWNNCVRQAVGRYVYIAGNDDIMASDFLEKQAAALDEFPECGLAHCRLKMIDEVGGDVPDWWTSASVFAWSSNGLFSRRHVRVAPFDGLLHLSGHSVYISLTQLLIRRSLFDQIGLFQNDWGPVGDFNWNMRAGLVASTVHVPDTWGGWRIHGNQATDWTRLRTTGHSQDVDDMVHHAIKSCEKLLAPTVRSRLTDKWISQIQELRRFFGEVSLRSDSLERRRFIAKSVLSGSRAARQYLKARSEGKWRWPEVLSGLVQNLLKDAGISPVLLPK